MIPIQNIHWWAQGCIRTYSCIIQSSHPEEKLMIGPKWSDLWNRKRVLPTRSLKPVIL